MGNSSVNIADDEMWCPECGAPIKKGFLTCSNCKLKVKMTRQINETQEKKKSPGKKKGKDSTPAKSQDKQVKENPLKKSGHPRYWNF